MKNNIKASIIITTFNKGDYLHLSLDSIFKQKPPFEYEVIVVDDGSTDKTKEVIKKYEDKIRYKYLDRPYYTNPAVAKNTAYAMAKGEVFIIQCPEVEHVSENSIELLTNTIKDDSFIIATVFNVHPRNRQIIMEYTGVNYKRPLFFLGSIKKEHMYAIGGDSEDFTEPGWEDTWFGFCLTEGLKLKPDYRKDIVAYHYDHPRPYNVCSIHSKMEKIYKEKEMKFKFKEIDYNNNCIEKYLDDCEEEYDFSNGVRGKFS